MGAPGRRRPGEGARACPAGVGRGCAEPESSSLCLSVPCIRPGVQLSRFTSKCFESCSSSLCHPPDLFALLQLPPNPTSLPPFWWQNDLSETQI